MGFKQKAGQFFDKNTHIWKKLKTQHKPKWKSPNESIEIHEPTPKHMTEPANQSEQTMSYNQILAKHRQSPSYSPPKSIDQQILREQYAIAVRSGSTEPERPERTSPKKNYATNQIQESGNESDSRAARMRLKARERRSDHSDLDEVVKSNTKESFLERDLIIAATS